MASCHDEVRMYESDAAIKQFFFSPHFRITPGFTRGSQPVSSDACMCPLGGMSISPRESRIQFPSLQVACGLSRLLPGRRNRAVGITLFIELSIFLDPIGRFGKMSSQPNDRLGVPLFSRTLT